MGNTGIETGDSSHSLGGADLKTTCGRVETTDMGSDGEDSKVREAVRSAMGFLAGLASDYGISEDSLHNAIQAARSRGVTDLRAARRAQKKELSRGHEKALLDPRLSVE